MFGRKSKEKIRLLEKAMSAEVATTEALRKKIDELTSLLMKESERADKAESSLAAARRANKSLKALNAKLSKKVMLTEKEKEETVKE